MRRSLLLLILMLPPACGGPETAAPVDPDDNRSAVVASEVELMSAPTAPAGEDRKGIQREAKAAEPGNPGACRIQDGTSVPPNPLRAVGTEPFWGARIDGRCVTYSHPEDPSGLRIWTRFSGTAKAGRWTGNYGGKPFVLSTRTQSECSDGMSDRRYPIAVTLTVSGEERQGCADQV